MGTPFLSEIKIISWNFAPRGWALCNGQFLPINQNQALFALLGTTYGGNGQTTFALPDLRARVPIHMGSHTLGERGGEEAHTLSISEIPTHVHALSGTSASSDPNGVAIPTANLLAAGPSEIYAAASSLVAMGPSMLGNVGGSQAHTNMMPFLVLNFCIALQGVFPSQN